MLTLPTNPVSQSLIDDIINAVNTYVYQAITSLETGLNSAPPERLGFKPSLPTATERGGAPADATPDYVEAKKEIEEGLHKLETLLESTVDKNFDKLEIYVLRNILSVPEDLANWIQLGHYEVRKLAWRAYFVKKESLTPSGSELSATSRYTVRFID